MNTNQGALYFGAGIDLNQWRRDIDSMRRDILGLNNTVRNETQQIDSSFKNLGLGIAGYFSANALKGFVMELINVRGEFQKTEIAFSTMLGDGVKAKALMGQMVDLAAKTPFDLQDISNGAKQLLAFQVPANEVVDTLTRMGNIAAGLSVPLARINLVYGQVRAKGKLMGDDLRQFTEAGIPMVAELAKKFNKTTAEVSAMVSAGKIGFKDVKDVLFSLTDEGGMFFNLMEKQSTSLSGKIANLGDSWDQMLNKIGEGNEGVLADGIDSLNYLVEHYEEVGKALKTLIEIYGAYRVALALTATMQGRMATPALIQGFSNLIKVIRGATVAQTALNATTLANPYILLATGIAAVVAICYNYRTELGQLVGIIDKATDKTKYQATVDKEFTQTFSQGIVEKKAKIEQLIAVINNENSKLDDRKRAYEKLIALDPVFRNTLDDQFKSTNRLADAFDHVIKKMQAMALAQAEIAVKAKYLQEKAQADFDVSLAQVKYDEAERKINQWADMLKAGKIDIKEYAKLGKSINWDETLQALIDAKKVQSEITKETNYANKAEENKLKTLKAQETILIAQLNGGKVQGKPISDGLRAKMKKDLDIIQAQLGEYAKKIEETISEGDTPKLGIIEKLQEELKAVNEAIEKEVSEKNLPALRNKRDFLKKKIDELLGTKGKSEKQIAEILPLGSIAELQRRAQLISDAIQVAVDGQVKLRKLDKYGKDKDKQGNPYLTGEIISKEEAYNRIESINEKIKALQHKSFDEQLSELERRIKIRDKLLENGYSKEDADFMFPELVGKDLLKSYQELQANLNKTMSDGRGTQKTAENYQKVTTVIDSLIGKQSALDKFNSNTEEALSKLTTATEKLSYLNDLQSKLSDKEISNGLYSSSEDIKRGIVKEQKNQYNELLKTHQSFEEKRNEISKQASDKRIQILNDESLGPNKIAELTKKVTKDEKQQTSSLALEEFEKSDAWLMLYENIDHLTTYQIDKLLQELEAKAPEFTKLMTPTDFNSVISAFKGIKKRISDENPFLGLVNSFRDLTLQMGEKSTEVSEISIQNFNKVAESAGGIFKNLDRAVGDLDEFRGFLSEGANDALSSIQDFAQGGILVVKTTGDAVNGISSAVSNALDNASWSNWITAIIQIIYLAIKAIVSLVTWLGKIGDKRKEKQIKGWADEVKNLKEQYDALKEAIDRALGDDVYKNQTQMIANLREQQRLLEQMKQKEIDKKKTDNDKVDEYTQQINDINNQINDIYDNISQSITQTNAKDLASDLADALIEAYGKGADAAEAYGQVADDVMKNAVKNALKMQLLEKPMQNIIQQLIKNMGFNADGTGSFDGLTEEERNQIKEQIGQASNNYMQALSAYSDLFGDIAGNASSLEGAVKGVTEETASVIAGQMNAIRIMQAEALSVNRESQSVLRLQLVQLVQIEFNTRYLKGIYEGIQAMRDKYGFRGTGLV